MVWPVIRALLTGVNHYTNMELQHSQRVYSSVAECPTADRLVPSSNLGAPFLCSNIASHELIVTVVQNLTVQDQYTI